MSNPFSIRGRMSRRQYAFYTLLIVLISYGFLFAIGSNAVAGGAVRNAGMLGMMVAIASAILQGLLAVRRLHDLGKPGHYVWLFLVPFYNIYFSLILCFERGTGDDNEHGSVQV